MQYLSTKNRLAYGELITGLRRPGEPAYMEDYLRDRELPNALDDPYFNIKKYKQRPEDYFNFGKCQIAILTILCSLDFKYADYEVFFAKQILMRMEKALIKEAIYKKPEAPK